VCVHAGRDGRRSSGALRGARVRADSDRAGEVPVRALRGLPAAAVLRGLEPGHLRPNCSRPRPGAAAGLLRPAFLRRFQGRGGPAGARDGERLRNPAGNRLRGGAHVRVSGERNGSPRGSPRGGRTARESPPRLVHALKTVQIRTAGAYLTRTRRAGGLRRGGLLELHTDTARAGNLRDKAVSGCAKQTRTSHTPQRNHTLGQEAR